MIFFLDKISKLRCRWNEIPLTETDFYRLCRKHKIVVREMPLRVGGFYYCLKGTHYIAIDSQLSELRKLFTMFHEFAHYLRHVPDTNTTANFLDVGEKTIKEKEADIFALCALIPKLWVETKTVRELIEDECLPEEWIWQRKEIYDTYKI